MSWWYRLRSLVSGLKLQTMILYLPLEMSMFYMKGSMPEIAMTDIMPSGWILDSDRFDRTPEVVPAIELVHCYKWIHFILYLKWAASAGCRHLNIMNKWNTRLGWYVWEGFSHFGTVVKLRLRASIEPWLPFFFNWIRIRIKILY